MKSIILGLSTIALLASCDNKEKIEKDISANIQNYNQPQVILEKLSEGKILAIDTSTVDPQGNFSFDGSVDEKSFYRLNFSNQGFVFFVSSPEENITVSLDAENYRDYTISGSEDAQILKSFNDGMLGFFNFQDSLNKAFAPYQNHPNKDSIMEAFRNKYQNSEIEKQQFITQFLDQNASSYASMAIVEQLDKDGFTDYYIKVKDGLASKYTNNPTYAVFADRVEGFSRLAVGQPIPEIVLPTPTGSDMALSSLKGQYVLVDFWASWCKPCRMENPNIVAEYEKYKSQGFTVFGVSLDREKAAWTNAIAADNLDWAHVSDLSFWNSAVVPQFGIEGIPFSILIDKEGKIIAKNLRGPALGRKLDEIFN